jgi:hypothetical protein
MKSWFTRRGVLGALLGTFASVLGLKQARAASETPRATLPSPGRTQTSCAYDAFTGVSSQTVCTYDEQGRLLRTETTYEYGPPTADATFQENGGWTEGGPTVSLVYSSYPGGAGWTSGPGTEGT